MIKTTLFEQQKKDYKLKVISEYKREKNIKDRNKNYKAVIRLSLKCQRVMLVQQKRT